MRRSPPRRSPHRSCWRCPPPHSRCRLRRCRRRAPSCERGHWRSARRPRRPDRRPSSTARSDSGPVPQHAVQLP
ncbi:hypothetical protein ETR14_14720 [Sphingosinicella sp. BN140058]|nr:hypothetical protein ETR14_14720 [Sphingosinicella sp. BN140058]